ncbi:MULTISPECIES: class I SAM-dependent methyltransferase [Chelativorans]|uniref:16S rRNA m(2)G 1207 methyltransferase n=1 Tax=Chelativorans sp. (strain BNC1) TaxID=266779 RepID=Q11BC2_CHESB|nr:MULTISPECIES: class I SAM-dependent methyltransferase [Chelativorans]
MHEALPTLLYPFERGILDLPGAGARLLVLGASAGLRLPETAAEVDVVVDFRPDFLALEKAGFAVSAEVKRNGYDAALLLLGRNRRENEARLAEALRSVHPGGIILAAGMKKDGAQSLRKQVAERLPLENAISKFHGLAFWLRRPERLEADVLSVLSGPAGITPEGYETAVGGFSEGLADPGSRFLIDNLPPDISGKVADFAAGWGFLSLRLVERFSIMATDLYEAHLPSLESARRNLAEQAPGVNCRYFWHDLLNEPVPHRYDVILMNPPFHRGRAAEPEIGRGMIGAAAKALNPGGRLFLVANRGLPYERIMENAFRQQGEIARDESYKVLWGRK